MKKKIISLIAMLALPAMNIVAQSNGFLRVTETRNSNPYHHIHVTGEMNVTLIQDDVHGVAVEGNRYQVGNMMTILRDDTLFVYQMNTHKKDEIPLVTIHVRTLVSLDVTGKTKVDCTGLVNADYLIIRAQDGAQIKLDVRALKIDSKVVGCSFIDLSGSTGSSTEHTDGCGMIDLHQLDVIETEINSSTI